MIQRRVCLFIAKNYQKYKTGYSYYNYYCCFRCNLYEKHEPTEFLQPFSKWIRFFEAFVITTYVYKVAYFSTQIALHEASLNNLYTYISKNYYFYFKTFFVFYNNTNKFANYFIPSASIGSYL